MSKFSNYIDTYKQISNDYQLNWSLLVNEDGFIDNINAWDLTQLSKSLYRTRIRLNNFSLHPFYISYCNAIGQDVIEKKLNDHWQDLIKAYCIEKLLIDKITAASVQSSIIRPLHIMASFLNYKDPTKITSQDIAKIYEIIQEITGNDILSKWILSVSKNLIDKNFISDFSPITVQVKFLLSNNNAPPTKEVLDGLNSRTSIKKLPNKDAFWELIRIIFTIEPRSYVDQIKFAQIQLLVMTGLRIGEIVKLPKDCIIGPFEVLTDLEFKSNAEFGAIKEYYKLKYFAEKQISGNRINHRLEVAYYCIPPIFLEPIKSIISLIEKLSEPLRKTLISIENNFFYINKKNVKYISAVDVYLLITGNPNFLEGFSDRISEIKKLNISERYSILESHIEYQKKLRGTQFTPNFYEFFQKLKGVLTPYNPTSKIWTHKINWWDAQFKASDVANYLDSMPSKLPDKYHFTTDTNEKITSSDFLFLYPKRAILETRNDGLIDISRIYSIGVPDRQFLETFLKYYENTNPTIFQIYSPDNLKDKQVMPHSLRHLLNTELYRQGISTIAITKHFNRKSIAQTLVYDHRNLIERFEEIQITQIDNEVLNERTVELAKLIQLNRASGPIVQQFKLIQKRDGDEAAFIFLNTEAGGIHTTPYGYCLNSFSVDPCPKHLECFSGCHHLSATNLPEHRKNLEILLARFLAHKQKTTELPLDSFGRQNKITYLDKKIKGIVQLLDTEIGQKVFPDGKDFSVIEKDIFDEE